MKPKRKKCVKLLAILHKVLMTLNTQYLLVWQVSVLTWSDGNAFASTRILCLSEVGL